MTVLVFMPPQLRIREESWQRSDPRIRQQSEFTGRGRDLLVGPAARWRCTADIVTMTDADIDEVIGFLAHVSKAGHSTLVALAGPGGQQIGVVGASATGLVRGAGQLGLSLQIDGLTPSIRHLRRGQFINFGSDSGDAQVGVLINDLVANGAGQATADLDQPIRTAPLDNSIVHLAAPFLWMRITSPLQFSRRLYQLHEVPPLQFEENF